MISTWHQHRIPIAYHRDHFRIVSTVIHKLNAKGRIRHVEVPIHLFQYLSVLVGRPSGSVARRRNGKPRNQPSIFHILGQQHVQLSRCSKVDIAEFSAEVSKHYPHFGMHVMVWRVRRTPGRQRGFVHFQRLSCSQLALQNSAHFSIVESVHRQLVIRIIRRGEGVSASAKASSTTAADKSPGSRTHISRRVIVMSASRK